MSPRLAWTVARLLALGPLLAASTSAFAQEACEPLQEEEFRLVVADAFDAIADDDPEKHGRLVRALQARVPCLRAPVPSGAWAEFLYGLALVRYAQGAPWQDTVRAALLADPGLERRFGPLQIRQYAPAPPEPDIVRPDLDGASLYIDGRPAPQRFALPGPHIVQKEERGTWTSAWVDDGALPGDWLPVDDGDRPGRDTALRVHAGVGVDLGFGPERRIVGATEPSFKAVLPVEVGVRADLGAGWVRLVGTFTPMLNGPYVFETDDGDASSRLGGGVELAGGGRFGIGHVGGLVGFRDPSRLVFQAVGGLDVHSSGVGLELRGGVHYTTANDVEGSVGLMVVYAPRVWRRSSAR